MKSMYHALPSMTAMTSLEYLATDKIEELVKQANAMLVMPMPEAFAQSWKFALSRYEAELRLRRSR